MRVPLNPVKSLCDDEVSGSDPWDWWDRFRANANFEKRVGAVLEIDAEAPAEHRLKRWLGEPIKALVVNTR